MIEVPLLWFFAFMNRYMLIPNIRLLEISKSSLIFFFFSSHGNRAYVRRYATEGISLEVKGISDSYCIVYKGWFSYDLYHNIKEQKALA